jgi:CheY-like chemotaxis protein/HPt (histidine-containing phosphotransfer) domain-containing protein
MPRTPPGDSESYEPSGVRATRAARRASRRHVPGLELPGELAGELEQVFRTELRDRIGAMKAAISELARGLGQTERSQIVGSLIRHAHSLKGAAQIVGLARLAAVAGDLEKRLDAAPHDEEAARRAVDAIARMGERFGLEGLDEDTAFAVAPQSREDAAAEREAAGSGPEGPLRILYVEDGQVNRALVRAIFTRTREPRVRGCVLLDAGSLAEARAVLRSQVVDLVLLDVRLPDGDGLDLARELRNSPGQRTPVVVVSASVLPAERVAALEAGGDQFMPKPLDPAQLVATVAALAPNRVRRAS